MASTPERPSRAGPTARCPVVQAEQARHVVAVLGRIEDLLVAERAGSLPDTAPSLSRLVEDVTRSELRGYPQAGLDTDEVADAAEVAEAVLRELARDLPPVLRVLGRNRRRWALALHDERRGERDRTLDLVRATHRRIGGAPRHPSNGSRPAVALDASLTPGAGPDGPDHDGQDHGDQGRDGRGHG